MMESFSYKLYIQSLALQRILTIDYYIFKYSQLQGDAKQLGGGN